MDSIEVARLESLRDARMLAIAAEEIDHAILIGDSRGRVLYANRAFGTMFGHTSAEIIGRNPVELLAREGFDAATMERIRVEVAEHRTFEEETLLTTKAGQQLWVSTLVKPLFDAAGALAHYLIVFSDISDSKQIQRLQRDVLEAIAHDRPIKDVMDLISSRVEAMAPDVVCSILAVDDEMRLHPVSAPSLPDYFGAAIDGIKAGPSEGSCGTAAWSNSEIIVEDIATDPLWDKYRSLPLPLGLQACWSSPITLRDGRVAGTFAFYYRQKRGPSDWHRHIVKACVNLSVVALERQAAKANIDKLAYYDALTGLPNRAKLRLEMERRFDEVDNPEPAALIFLDIDHFKDVNDTLGHSVGDAFLTRIAERLRAAVWPEDIISRHGGDEFVIVLAGANEPRAKAVAEVLLEKISEPVIVDGISLPASASIGISLCPQDGTDSATLLRNADTAMYRAKGEGRNTYRFFTAEMNRMAQDRLLLGALLRDALGKGQISLHYQPQMDARSGQLAGVEALARWKHPALGYVPPSRFIPLAEDCGLIGDIGEIAIREATRQMALWDEAGFEVPQVAVNISPTQFRNPGLPQIVAEALGQSGIAAHRLIIEITEGVMMDESPAALANAAALRTMGVSISMDDFGTGYSSLSHLARLPVSELKIDRSFMANLEDSDAVRALVTAVVRIGESLRLTVVAEGVETVAQRRFLEALGCDVLQGYLFGEAMAPEDFAAWLRARSKPADVAAA